MPGLPAFEAETKASASADSDAIPEKLLQAEETCSLLSLLLPGSELSEEHAVQRRLPSGTNAMHAQESCTACTWATAPTIGGDKVMRASSRVALWPARQRT